MREYWNISDIGLYDPVVKSYKLLPHKTFDLVISTYMLEPSPEYDLGWIVSEIFSLSEIFVFCTVALYGNDKPILCSTELLPLNKSSLTLNFICISRI